MSQVQSDLSSLSNLARELAQMLVTVAGDVVLVVDAAGIIKHIRTRDSMGADDTSSESWVGQPLTEIVTGETRRKVEELLRDVTTTGVSRLRQVNHPSAAGPDVPIAYTAVQLGEQGPVLAVGRDLRAVSMAQHQFVATQHAMERDFWKRRQAETRYRLLFDIAPDPLFVVDAKTMRLVEANQSAAQLFSLPAHQLIGQHIGTRFTAESKQIVENLLRDACSQGVARETQGNLEPDAKPVRIYATCTEPAEAALVLVRARELQMHADASETSTAMLDLVRQAADAIVLVDSHGQVLETNPAFLALAQVTAEDDARGHQLADWLGAGGELRHLLMQVEARGAPHLAQMSLRGQHGRVVAIQLSVTLLPKAGASRFGIILRTTGADGAVLFESPRVSGGPAVH
jgi:transcriptional regulator PpsR